MSSLKITLVPDNLISQDGTVVSLAGKRVGLYFSAHWCPPCRAFTPALSARYLELIKDGENFVLIFISSDADQDGFDEYWKTMSFPALKFSARAKKQALANACGVGGIPTLCIFDENLTLITKEGRNRIMTEKPSEMGSSTRSSSRSRSRSRGSGGGGRGSGNGGPSTIATLVATCCALAAGYLGGEQLAQKTEVKQTAASVWGFEVPTSILDVEILGWWVAFSAALFALVFYFTAGASKLKPIGYVLPLFCAIAFAGYTDTVLEEEDVYDQIEHIYYGVTMTVVLMPILRVVLGCVPMCRRAKKSKSA